MPGWLESLPTDIAQSMMCAISRTHDGPKVVLCFRHATPSHYHHDAWLLACVKHIKFILYRGCVSGVIVLSYSVIYIYIYYIYIYIYRGNTGTLFPSLMCSLWYVQMIGYIMACRSCSFVCKLQHPIIIIMQTYLKALNY